MQTTSYLRQVMLSWNHHDKLHSWLKVAMNCLVFFVFLPKWFMVSSVFIRFQSVAYSVKIVLDLNQWQWCLVYGCLFLRWERKFIFQIWHKKELTVLDQLSWIGKYNKWFFIFSSSILDFIFKVKLPSLF